MAADFDRRTETDLEEALIDLGTHLPHPPTADLTGRVLEDITAGEPTPDQPSSC